MEILGDITVVIQPKASYASIVFAGIWIICWIDFLTSTDVERRLSTAGHLDVAPVDFLRLCFTSKLHERVQKYVPGGIATIVSVLLD